MCIRDRLERAARHANARRAAAHLGHCLCGVMPAAWRPLGAGHVADAQHSEARQDRGVASARLEGSAGARVGAKEDPLGR
eukprot:12955693-Alexandrium_andersonii.AAC.1